MIKTTINFLFKNKRNDQVTESRRKAKFDACAYNVHYKSDLLIFDDFLPNLLGSWRAAEMVYYLKNFDTAKLICLKNFYKPTDKSKIANREFNKDKETFLNTFSLKSDVVIPIDNDNEISVNTKLAYCLFINNLIEIFPVLERFQIPFAFTLYPGGGFKLYDPECEKFLEKLKQSKLFKGLIVTQQSTKDYLINRLSFSEKKIKFIYGGTMDLTKYHLNHEKKYYGINKDTLDICFVASKYMHFGIDKGFDVFCNIAASLSNKYDFIKFHVIGGFNQDDLLYPVKQGSITFYNHQNFEWFKNFYSDIDIIVSPVKANVLAHGAFDGFPTGAVVDASLFGVAMMTADPTGDNVYTKFEDEKDIFLIESNCYSILKKIDVILSNPEKIKNVSIKGKEKAFELFNSDYQFKQRLNFLKTCMQD